MTAAAPLAAPAPRSLRVAPRRAARWLVLAALAAGCRHAPTDAPTTHAPRPAPGDARVLDAPAAPASPLATTSADADTAAAAPGQDTGDPALLTLADQLAAAVARARGLPVLRPIAKGVLDRGQILARLRARVREEYAPGEVALEAEIMRRLGLIPAAMDYEATVYDLLEEQVAGFYDPSAHRLFIASWLPTEMQAATLSHEIVHALQDQHFGIARFTHHVRGGGDAQTAAMAVVEGDATFTILEAAAAQQGQSLLDAGTDPDAFFRTHVMDLSGQPRLAAAPRALRETLLFPYRAGFVLCTEQYRAGGFAAIDALLRTPPASTEQVLHPAKLAAHEPPVAVPAATPAPLASDYRLAFDDVMGELGARLYLESGVSDAAAAAAAAGWGGDRAMLFVPASAPPPASDAGGAGDGGGAQAAALGASVLVWALVFDPSAASAAQASGSAAAAARDGEAQEFERAAVAVLARRYPTAPARAVAGATRAVETAPGRVALVARRGRAVVVLDRVPAERAAALAAAVLAQTASAAPASDAALPAAAGARARGDAGGAAAR